MIKDGGRAGKTCNYGNADAGIHDQEPNTEGREVTDIANAIYDGTTAIMLSGESAAGLYPVKQ